MPVPLPDRPLPLDLSEPDVKRVIDYLYRAQDDSQDVRDRLQIEILDALRRIDDKLGKLLAKP